MTSPVDPVTPGDAAICVIVRSRQGGKTTAAIEWLSAGECTTGYPGWTRVLVTPNRRQYDHLRRLLRGKLDDIDHRLYDARTWFDALNVDPTTQVMLDNIEMMLPRIPGTLAGMTVTGAELLVAEAVAAERAKTANEPCLSMADLLDGCPERNALEGDLERYFGPDTDTDRLLIIRPRSRAAADV